MRNERETGIAGAAAGLALAAGGLAFGAFLSRRHAGGGDDAPPYTRRRPDAEGAVLGRTVTIRKPRAELYRHWRDFSNLPHVMENVETIRKEGEAHVWVIKAPAGRTVEVRTRIAEEVENQRIAWQSVEGSEIETSGRVEFTDAPGERGTRVLLVMSYDPPAGALGQAVARLFLREPQVQARHDLKRFKMLMETGEVATSARRRDEGAQARQENGR